ncbi:hypothetical protein ACWXVO_01190 [Mycoplasma sp. 1890]
MSKKDLLMLENRINSCTTFGEFLRNIFTIANIKTNDVCKRIKADRRKIFNLLNDLRDDVSLNLIQDLEKMLDLKIGYLTNKWYFFRNNLNVGPLDKAEIIKRLGWEILEKNRYLTNILGDNRLSQSPSEEEIIEFLEKYYGTLNIEEYSKYISKHLYINHCKITKHNRIPFIRFCELFIRENFKGKDIASRSRFKEYLPKFVIVRLIDTLFNEIDSFDEKISKVSLLLKDRNIELIKLPYIEKTMTRSITFSFGPKKYIIITDMYNSEILILFSLFREIMICFNPWLSREEYYEEFRKKYDIWRGYNKARNLRMIDDILEGIKQISLLDKNNANFYENILEIYKSIAKKYKKIKF